MNYRLRENKVKYRRKLKYYLLKLVHLKDSPRAVAGGIAWGAFVNFYPTFGIGPFLAAGIARLCQGNIAAATLGWAIFMPLFPLFFYLNLVVGNLFTNVPAENVGIVMQGFSHLLMQDFFVQGKAFLIGSLINGCVCVIIIWFAGYFFLKKYRKKTQELIRRNF